MKQRMGKTVMTQGFTLVEVITGISIMMVLMIVAIPAFVDMNESNSVKAAAERYFNTMQYVRTESIRKHSTIFVSFQTGTNWCFGIDDTASCDCNVANDCQVDGSEFVVKANEFNNVDLTLSNFTGTSFSFEGVRGTTNDAGFVTLARNDKSVQVNVDFTGRTRICSNTVQGYQSC